MEQDEAASSLQCYDEFRRLFSAKCLQSDFASALELGMDVGLHVRYPQEYSSEAKAPRATGSRAMFTHITEVLLSLAFPRLFDLDCRRVVR